MIDGALSYHNTESVFFSGTANINVEWRHSIVHYWGHIHKAPKFIRERFLNLKTCSKGGKSLTFGLRKFRRQQFDNFILSL